MNKSTAKTFSPLVANVVEGIEEVKGENIAVLDLRNLENSVVIPQETQVKSRILFFF